MACTDTKPCYKPVLRWAHSKTCQAGRKKLLPNEDLLQVRLEKAQQLLQTAVQDMKDRDYGSCAIRIGSATTSLLEAIHFAYDCARYVEPQPKEETD